MANNADIGLNLNLNDGASKKIKLLESRIIRFVGAVTAALASIRAIAFPVSEATEFEASLKDVQKTTGFTDEEISRLSDTLLASSRRFAQYADDLAKIAAIAGQLGLGEQGRRSVEKFTQSVAIATTTLGISSEAVAEIGSQITSIYNIAAGNVERVFSTLNELSNNSVAAASDLGDIIKRVGTTSGATFIQVAGLAATLRELGVPNEQAGTALVKFLSNLLSESRKFSELIGITNEEWITRVQTDAVEALKDVLSALSRLRAGTREALTRELFGSGRLFSAANKLIDDASNNFAKLDKFVRIADESFEDGQSSIKEYEKIMESLAKQVDLLKASFSALAIDVGNQILPTLLDSVQRLISTINDESTIDFFVDIGSGIATLIGNINDLIVIVTQLNAPWGELLNIFIALLSLKVGVWLVSLVAPMVTLGKSALKLLFGISLVNTALATTRVATGAALVGFTSVIAKWSAGLATLLGLNKLIGAVSASITGLGATWLGVAARLVGGLGIVGVIATAVYLGYEAFSSFIGFVDEEVAAKQREADQAQKEVSRKIDDAVSLYNEGVKKIRDQGFETLDADNILIAEGVDAYGQALTNLALKLDTASNAISSYQGVLLGLDKEQQSLEKQYKKTSEQILATIVKLDKQRQEFNSRQELTVGSFFGPTETDIRDTENYLNTLIGLRDRYKNQLQEISERRTGAGEDLKFLNEQYLIGIENLQKFSDVNVRAFISNRADIASLSKEIEEITEKYEEASAKLDQFQASKNRGNTQVPIVSEEDLRTIKESPAIIEQLNNKMADLVKRSDGLASNIPVGLRSVAEGVKGLDADSVIALGNAFSKLAEESSNSSKVVSTLALNIPSALIGYFNALKLRDGIVNAASAAEAFAKKAEGAFDNTNNELSALNQRFLDFEIDFNSRFKTLSIDVRLENIEEDIDEDLEKKKDRVSSYYDTLIRASDAATARLLENKKKEKIADLEDEATKEKAAAKAKSLRIQLNDALQLSASLAQEAAAAAKLGRLDEALTLKNAAKNSITQAMDLFSEMQKLRTVDFAGDIKLEFSKGELVNTAKEIGQASTNLGGNIADINTNLRDAAVEVDKTWSAAKVDIEATVKQQKSVIDLMAVTFKDFESISKDVASIYKDATANLSGPVEELIALSKNPVALVGSDVDISSLLDSINTSVSLVAPDLAATISEAISSKLKTIDSDIEFTIPSIDDVRLNSRQQQIDAYLSELDKAIEAGAGITPNVTFDQAQVQEEATKIKPTFESELTAILNVQVNRIRQADIQAGDSAQRFASGGAVRGPGTGTSDSILAWLSNNEFVIPADVTKALGGSKYFYDLIDTVRGGKSPAQVFNTKSLPGFAGGGSPAATDNGFAQYTIVINGGKPVTLYSELENSVDVIDALQSLNRG